MSNEFIGLTHGDALGRGGERLGAESQNLLAQAQNLRADMEGAGNAIQGAGLNSLNGALRVLMEHAENLIRWCNENGIKLGDAQTAVGHTVERTVDDFDVAQAGLNAIPRQITI
ncbi:hypothetical protein [Actinomadura algeriensis]|uniref:Uncharacterized protein n=1 Tax=Actinomadura algeriensis TaxID=1679523 RepID=A0ABR9JNL0_9ACTN|nr:hypothetical protein [Actinomadura algeriensis]MBE1532093.1 hypothetical protein [Actinomadura algeriensis]